jgi:hypothetical protein
VEARSFAKKKKKWEEAKVAWKATFTRTCQKE